MHAQVGTLMPGSLQRPLGAVQILLSKLCLAGFPSPGWWTLSAAESSCIRWGQMRKYFPSLYPLD